MSTARDHRQLIPVVLLRTSSLDVLLKEAWR